MSESHPGSSPICSLLCGALPNGLPERLPPATSPPRPGSPTATSFSSLGCQFVAAAGETFPCSGAEPSDGFANFHGFAIETDLPCLGVLAARSVRFPLAGLSQLFQTRRHSNSPFANQIDLL